MIFDHLDNAELYYSMHPGFKAAFEFLRSADLMALKPGRNEVDGDRLFAVAARKEEAGRREPKLEIHRKYIDIQYSLKGADAIGWKPAAGCAGTGQGFDAQKDIEFFTAKPDTFIITPPGTFAIFFPEEPHAPMTSEQRLQKVVMKVALKY